MTKKLVTLFLAAALVMASAIPALATNFTPSVEQKPAPEVAPQTGSDGQQYAAIIYDEDGQEVVGVPFPNLIVTPIAEADSAATEIKDTLKDAYEQIKSVRSLTELSPDLEKAVAEYSSDIKVEDLVVQDLFDVTINDEFREMLNKEGFHVTIRFKLSADARNLAAVLHNLKGNEWETVSNDRIVRNNDKTVDVTFYSLSPIAFLFEAGQLGTKPNAPTSPQTSDPGFNATALTVAGGAVILAAAAFVTSKKRSA